ncbi:MAG: J domain-containing protein [Dongiaceae bacterium]
MRRRLESSAEAPPEERPLPWLGCDHPDCAETGLYRAPKARGRLNDYFRFCLDHVRAYNREWNYCAGMTEAEMEAQLRLDTVGWRPSWPLGALGGRWPWAATFDDALGIFAAGACRRRPPTAEEKALAVLDLTPPTTLAEIKRRYKTLVKRLHPDANGGDTAAEERLKLVNQAYSMLKTAALA